MLLYGLSLPAFNATAFSAVIATQLSTPLPVAAVRVTAVAALPPPPPPSSSRRLLGSSAYLPPPPSGPKSAGLNVTLALSTPTLAAANVAASDLLLTITPGVAWGFASLAASLGAAGMPGLTAAACSPPALSAVPAPPAAAPPPPRSYAMRNPALGLGLGLGLGLLCLSAALCGVAARRARAPDAAGPPRLSCSCSCSTRAARWFVRARRTRCVRPAGIGRRRRRRRPRTTTRRSRR